MDTAEVLADAIGSAVTSGNHTHLVVDLDQVTFLDSTGINVLMAGRNLADEYGVVYLVANPHDTVRQVLDVTGVLATLSTVPSRAGPGHDTAPAQGRG
jgi:anti-sigma B factor antagonist